jgi:hypothetical protein
MIFVFNLSEFDKLYSNQLRLLTQARTPPFGQIGTAGGESAPGPAFKVPPRASTGGYMLRKDRRGTTEEEGLCAYTRRNDHAAG